MRRLEHFILTRFNVVEDDYLRDRQGRAVRTTAWLRHRFALFERFCLPSVRAQTNLAFTWLVRYDERTPPPYLERLRRHERALRNLVLVPSSRDFGLEIAMRLERSTLRVLTTRLDNDDALHRDAVALIQGSARATHGLEFLNPRHGCCYSHPGGPLTRVEDRSSPFLSLCEPASGELPHTARCVEHRRALEFAPVRQIGDGPMWLQVVHGRNLNNEMRGERCDGIDLEASFGVCNRRYSPSQPDRRSAPANVP